MRTSKLYFPTLKEFPADAEIISHQLMLRAGLIRKLASGIYTWLPLGLRVLRNIEKVIREEMNSINAQEILMPAIQPAELWETTGRWEQYGPELLRISDRHDRLFCFGPTHEEVVTDLVRHELRSYKQLPQIFYQLQFKFRDEIRPRFGVMRAREFLMKDAYSFHRDKQSLQITYEEMEKAYHRIFTRLGLKYRAVHADTGNIGGSASKEFQVLADIGEDQIFYSDTSDYAANSELAESIILQNSSSSTQPLTKIATPGKETIEDVCNFLKIPPSQSIKLLLFKGKNVPVVGLILRGDHELNRVKAEKIPSVASPLSWLEESDIKRLTGTPKGYLGPLNLSIPLVIDKAAASLRDFVCGANETGYHFTHANWGRDIVLPEVADFRQVKIGEKSPDGKGVLRMARGIEVGHIFQLGTKYSVALNAEVTDENGDAIFLEMGCYGIGVSRILGAAIEQNHDENGIIWSNIMAPFNCVLIPIGYHRSALIKKEADALYQSLLEEGINILLEDREERPGVLFSDMDLIGIPNRLVLSERSLKEKAIEYKKRTQKEVQLIPLADIVKFLNTF